MRLLAETKYQLVVFCLQDIFILFVLLLVYSYNFAYTLNKTPSQELDVQATTISSGTKPSRFQFTTHSLALVQLTGCNAVPLITQHFQSHSCLAKQKISLEMARILSMCLCPCNQFTWNQKELLGEFYFCVKVCYETLY